MGNVFRMRSSLFVPIAGSLALAPLGSAAIAGEVADAPVAARSAQSGEVQREREKIRVGELEHTRWPAGTLFAHSPIEAKHFTAGEPQPTEISPYGTCIEPDCPYECSSCHVPCLYLFSEDDRISDEIIAPANADVSSEAYYRMNGVPIEAEAGQVDPLSGVITVVTGEPIYVAEMQGENLHDWNSVIWTVTPNTTSTGLPITITKSGYKPSARSCIMGTRADPQCFAPMDFPASVWDRFINGFDNKWYWISPVDKVNIGALLPYGGGLARSFKVVGPGPNVIGAEEVHVDISGQRGTPVQLKSITRTQNGSEVTNVWATIGNFSTPGFVLDPKKISPPNGYKGTFVWAQKVEVSTEYDYTDTASPPLNSPIITNYNLGIDGQYPAIPWPPDQFYSNPTFRDGPGLALSNDKNILRIVFVNYFTNYLMWRPDTQNGSRIGGSIAVPLGQVKWGAIMQLDRCSTPGEGVCDATGWTLSAFTMSPTQSGGVIADIVYQPSPTYPTWGGCARSIEGTC